MFDIMLAGVGTVAVWTAVVVLGGVQTIGQRARRRARDYALTATGWLTQTPVAAVFFQTFQAGAIIAAALL